MKTRRIQFFLLSIMLVSAVAKAQSAKTDSVLWENGNVSLLSEIDPVWIILKKGDDLKNVRIKEIKKERGVLVYEKDKCLHDLFISNIKKIQAGKNSRSAMFFYADNTPYIKTSIQYADETINYTEFKSVKMPERVINKPEITKPVIEETPFAKSNGCDTIIDLAGNIILVKITDLNPKLISYKKISNPDGPIYIKANTNTRITRYADCITVHFLEKY